MQGRPFATLPAFCAQTLPPTATDDDKRAVPHPSPLCIVHALAAPLLARRARVLAGLWLLTSPCMDEWGVCQLVKILLMAGVLRTAHEDRDRDGAFYESLYGCTNDRVFVLLEDIYRHWGWGELPGMLLARGIDHRPVLEVVPRQLKKIGIMNLFIDGSRNLTAWRGARWEVLIRLYCRLLGLLEYATKETLPLDAYRQVIEYLRAVEPFWKVGPCTPPLNRAASV